MTPPAGKLEGLNALRGIAVLLVLYFHFAPGEIAPAEFAKFTGTLGIVLFFFLSGFFMDRTLAQDGNVIAFAIKRAGRILPLYWVSLLAAFVIAPWTARDLFFNALFLVPFSKTELMSGVYWTLYIEVTFYALVPVIALSGRRVIAAALYAAIAFDFALAATKGHHSHTLFYLCFCLAGMQFGLWHRAMLSIPYLALAVAACVAHATALADQPLLMGMAAVISVVAMYLGLLYSNQTRGVLSFFGDISYSLYLLHAVVGLPAVKVLQDFGMGVWPSAAGGIALSIALSFATYRMIELPFMAAAHATSRFFQNKRVDRARLDT